MKKWLAEEIAGKTRNHGNTGMLVLPLLPTNQSSLRKDHKIGNLSVCLSVFYILPHPHIIGLGSYRLSSVGRNPRKQF